MKILQIFKLDAYSSEMRVMDCSNEIWHCQILNNKYKGLAAGMYIRVRQATIQNHKNYQNTFGFKVTSNIMVLPDKCKIGQEMKMNDDKMNKGCDVALLSEGGNGPMGHPVLLSKRSQVG